MDPSPSKRIVDQCFTLPFVPCELRQDADEVPIASASARNEITKFHWWIDRLEGVISFLVRLRHWVFDKVGVNLVLELSSFLQTIDQSIGKILMSSEA